MQPGTSGGPENPNAVYFNSRGMWITYIIIVAILHYVLLSLPFLSVAMAWTSTHTLHNIVSSKRSKDQNILIDTFSSIRLCWLSFILKREHLSKPLIKENHGTSRFGNKWITGNSSLHQRNF